MIAAGVETRIREAVTTVVSSREGHDLLLRTIEVAHERSVLLLRDELDQLPNVVVAEGQRFASISCRSSPRCSARSSTQDLDFVGHPAGDPAIRSAEDATAAIDRLASIVGRDLPPDFGQVRIASEESLEQAQGYVRAFDLALWALLIAAIVLGALAIWLAPSIPVGTIRVGVAAAIAALAGWGLVQVLAARVADAATTADGRVAITEIIQSLVNGLNGSAFALGVIGIGVAASGFIVDRQSRQALAAEGPAPEPPPRPPPAPAAAPKRTRRRAAAKTASSGTSATDAAATSPPAETPAAEAPRQKRRRSLAQAALDDTKAPATSGRRRLARRDFAQSPVGLAGGAMLDEVSSTQIVSISADVIAWKIAPTTASAMNARSQRKDSLTTASTPPNPSSSGSMIWSRTITPPSVAPAPHRAVTTVTIARGRRRTNAAAANPSATAAPMTQLMTSASMPKAGNERGADGEAHPADHEDDAERPEGVGKDSEHETDHDRGHDAQHRREDAFIEDEEDRLRPHDAPRTKPKTGRTARKRR